MYDTLRSRDVTSRSVRHCRARLESYMVPRHVEVRTDLPKTDSGKIRKASLVPVDADPARPVPLNQHRLRV